MDVLFLRDLCLCIPFERTHLAYLFLQTSVAFGGRDLGDLYVTSAMWGDEEGSPEAGSLFRVSGVGQGIPAKKFVTK
jgi:hypothetical protein